jgi:2-polyprenyl-3-methyl-5-hydroxy-6-metoxy-1,4-benzoquinol methylase
VGNTVKNFHDSFYTQQILDLDEKGNDFSKIAELWPGDPRPLKVLDIGCGAGSVTAELVRRGHTVYGIEIQDEAIKRARARGLQAKMADLNQPIDFPDRFFDVIVAMDIIEHLFDPLALLLDIHRMLKDDGCALIGIPQHFDIIQRMRMLFGSGIVSAEHLYYSRDYNSWNYIHIRLFRLNEAHEMIRRTGFSVDQSILLPVALFPFPLPVRAALKLMMNRFTRPVFPNLFASGVRLRVRKEFRGSAS